MRVDLPLLVREATPEDAAAIGTVHAEAWRTAHRDLFEGPWLRDLEAERRNRWTSLMAGPDFARNTLLVAERGDSIVAFVYFGPHVDGTPDAQIFDFYAQPTIWGTGIAGTLLDKAWEMVQEDGFRNVRLWTMAGANRARHFYASFGFEESGRRRERDFGDGRPVLEIEYSKRTRSA
jgi:RimJ/RimL family protein N-acetyltransferase